MTTLSFDLATNYSDGEEIILPRLSFDKETFTSFSDKQRVQASFQFGDLIYNPLLDTNYIFLIHSKENVFQYFSMYLIESAKKLKEFMQSDLIPNMKGFIGEMDKFPLIKIGNLYTDDYQNLFTRLQFEKKHCENYDYDNTLMLLEVKNVLADFMSKQLKTYFRLEHSSYCDNINIGRFLYQKQIGDIEEEKVLLTIDNLTFNYYADNKVFYIDVPIDSVFVMKENEHRFMLRFNDVGDLKIYSVIKDKYYHLLNDIGFNVNTNTEESIKKFPYNMIRSMTEQDRNNNYYTVLKNLNDIDYLYYL